MTRWLSLRTVALTVIAAALVAAMAWLGLWQYGAYGDHQRDDADAALARQPAPLDAVLGPDAPFPSDAVSRPITATGRYVAAEQFYVTGMADAGSALAVVTPLLTDSGSAVLVVRGLSTVRPAAAPAGEVSVSGVLEPSAGSAQPLDRTRTTDGIQIAKLVSSFDEDLYAGYVIARSSQPPDALRAAPVPQPDASFWAGVRNLLYAVQWWTFAAFVVFMWWRAITEPSTEADERDVDRGIGATTPDAGGGVDVG